MAGIDRCDDINQLHPYVKGLAQKLLDEAKKQGLNVRIIDTYRSKERQDYLYAQGRTRPGRVVTNAKGSDMTSYHQWRVAFDCIQNVPGKEYDNAFLDKLGKIGQKVGLEWGGNWSSFKDSPHFQYTFGYSIKQLKAGAKLPNAPQGTDNKGECDVKRTEIELNGVVKAVDTVMINGANYIKLRDLEDGKIGIDYNTTTKRAIVKVK